MARERGQIGLIKRTEIGGHLSKRNHDREAHGTHDDVSSVDECQQSTAGVRGRNRCVATGYSSSATPSAVLGRRMQAVIVLTQ